MIRSTFVHLPRIGESTEAALWAQGVTTWQALPAATLAPRQRWLADALLGSAEALADRDWSHFRKILHGRHAWRWFHELRDRAVYLDIETTGGPPSHHCITVVACYDGTAPTVFVRDQNLHELPAYLSEYDLLVTYNGSTFDVPHLRVHYPHLRLPPVHLDLRWPLHRLGLRGGLKRAERLAGLARDEDLQGVDGLLAIALWDRHRRGDDRALPTLLRYAAEDVLGLEPLAAFVYNQEVAARPVPVAALPAPPRRATDWPYSLELIWELQAAQENQ
ncbi:MAG: ribonuclease H-like domain-containing protein [Fimbriimonadaceae bacterium]|nr:ribonuclease H-like domain-containing protein [Fimbriimonadaceae bacterium]